MEDITINKKYAEKYKREKEQSELAKINQRLKIKEDAEEELSESEEEDDDAVCLDEDLDSQINNTIKLIRNDDPILYNKNIDLYEDKSKKLSKEKTSEERDSIKKPKLGVRDYMTQQLINRELSEDEDEIDEIGQKNKNTIVQKEKNSRASFFDAACEFDNSNTNDFLKLRTPAPKIIKKRKTETESKSKIVNKRKKESEKTDIESESKNLNKKENVQNLKHTDEEFLEAYANNEWWKGKNLKNLTEYNDVIDNDQQDSEIDLSEDEEILEKQDDFEREWNFRYENEADNTKLVTHSRDVPDSVRRKDNSRKRKRLEKKERKIEEKKQKAEEIQRQKNLKKKDILDKINAIQQISGLKDQELEIKSKDLETDFDPDDFDEKMEKIFDDEYYNTKIDIKKEEENINSNSDKSQSKLKDERNKKIQKHLDDLYNLNYEDIIDDEPCRFDYIKVKKGDFGLSMEDMLKLPDNELNQRVSLKKITPYRHDYDHNPQWQDIQKEQKKKLKRKREIDKTNE